MQAEWTREAESVAEERRSPEVANLPTASRQDHLFAWSQGGPQAGRRTLLAYNRAAGPLRYSTAPQIASIPKLQFDLENHGREAAGRTE